MVANYLHLDNMVQIHVRMYIRVFFNVEQKLEKNYFTERSYFTSQFAPKANSCRTIPSVVVDLTNQIERI